MSVYKRTPGARYYDYDFQYRGARFLGTTARTTRREAQAVEAELKRQARDQGGRREQRRDYTLNQLFDLYFQAHGQHTRSADWIDSGLAILLLSLGGTTRVSQLSDEMIRTRHIDRRKGLVANGTVNGDLRRLRAAINHGLKVARPRAAPPEDSIDWAALMLEDRGHRVRELQPQEEAAILRHLRPEAQEVFAFALWTGIRISDLIGLRWTAFNPIAGALTFRLSKRRGAAWHTVPLTPAMTAYLEELRGQHPEFIFTYCSRRIRKRAAIAIGTRVPFTRHGLGAWFRAACRAAGVEDYTWHDNRHTAASRVLRACGNLAVVQRMLGHSDIRTTSRYAHVLIDDVRNAMATAYDRESRNSPADPAKSDAK